MSHITSGFIDLACHGDQSKYMYGAYECGKCLCGPHSDAPELYQGTWRTYVDGNLKRVNDNNFLISKAGDWIEKLWINITVLMEPTLQIKNLAHNLFEEISIVTDDGLVIWSIDPYTLDYLANFNISAEKIDQYKQGINGICTGRLGRYLLLPLPFKVPLPICAIRNDLLVRYRLATISGVTVHTLSIAGRYRLISNEERIKNQTMIHHILIDNYQINRRSWAVMTHSEPGFDMNFSGPIKALTFALKNPAEFSAYYDKISRISVMYSQSMRIYDNIDFFTRVQPYFHAEANNGEPIGLYSYTNEKISDAKISASTNMSYLTNVSISPQYRGDSTDETRYEFIIGAMGVNILEIKYGKISIFTEGSLTSNQN